MKRQVCTIPVIPDVSTFLPYDFFLIFSFGRYIDFLYIDDAIEIHDIYFLNPVSTFDFFYASNRREIQV